MGVWATRLSIFAGLRAVALLISYEIPMALSLIGVLMIAGSLSLGRIVDAQNVPFILVQPMGFFVFFLASLAEMNRTPFDLTEAESELAAGYLNDYSSMKFGLFFLAEFMAALAGAAVITTLFLSGWRGFEPIPSHIWFFLKMGGVLFLIIWIRFTWPRLRIDQMLAFAWKGLFELTLVNLVLAAILIAIWPEPTTNQLWIMAAINWPVFFVSVFVISKVLGVKPHPYRKARGRSSLPCGDRRAQTASGGEMTGLNLLKGPASDDEELRPRAFHGPISRPPRRFTRHGQGDGYEPASG